MKMVAASAIARALLSRGAPRHSARLLAAWCAALYGVSVRQRSRRNSNSSGINV
jgi:hypothetical protein